MATKSLTVIDGRQSGLVDELRLAEYAGAPGFSVLAPGIVWNRSDDQSTVLAAWDGEELVSTLRLELIDNQALVEAKVECPWTFPVPLAFPVLILSKMATRRAYRKSGLNEVLRHTALELAMGWGAHQVVGTFVAGSPRKVAMAAMGYAFFENELGWHTTNYQSSDPVLVAVLDLAAQGQRALAVCRRMAGPSLAEWIWTGDAPERRFVEVLR